MPIVASRISVPANGQIDIMANTAYEYPPSQDGNQYSVMAVTEAAGLVLDIEFGSKNVGRGIPLRLVGASIAPATNQDRKAAEIALAGERVQVILRNTTGAAVFGNALVEIA